MARRIAIAILAVVWVTLVVGGIVAYWTTRTVLLADLDEGLRSRAMSLPEVAGAREGGGPLPLHEGDRYVVVNQVGRTVARSSDESAGVPEAQVEDADFVKLRGGTRLRRITLRIERMTTGTATTSEPLTVVFSGSAATFDRVLNRLAVVLLVLGVVSGIAAAGVAVRVSRAALRPLSTTADVIGTIDDRSLDRRIDVGSLPPELHAMAGRLNEMLARLEQATTARRQFVADASHELRTPVTALVTSMEVALRRPRDEATLRQTLADCLGDARLLRELVERLLQQVKSERPQADEPAEPVVLADVVAECVRVAAPLADAAQVTLGTDVPPGLTLCTQRGRLRGVLLNLVANAVEYNRPAGRVDVVATPLDGRVRIEVRDTGIGIAAEHLPKLFDPFYRVDPARTGGERIHLGLGLHLVATTTRALGGTCDVTSTPGAGTTFTLTLPIDPPVRDQS